MIDLLGWKMVGLLAVVAVSISDVLYRRVPNLLSAVIFLAGLTFWFGRAGWDGMTFALQGAALGFAIMLALYAANLMGAGDVKVFAAFGAWLGVQATLQALLYGSLFGGVLTFWIMVRSPLRVQTVIRSIIHNGMGDALARARLDGTTVPYAAALAVGALAAGAEVAP